MITRVEFHNKTKKRNEKSLIKWHEKLKKKRGIETERTQPGDDDYYDGTLFQFPSSIDAIC